MNAGAGLVARDDAQSCLSDTRCPPPVTLLYGPLTPSAEYSGCNRLGLAHQ